SGSRRTNNSWGAKTLARTGPRTKSTVICSSPRSLARATRCGLSANWGCCSKQAPAWRGSATRASCPRARLSRTRWNPHRPRRTAPSRSDAGVNNWTVGRAIVFCGLPAHKQTQGRKTVSNAGESPRRILTPLRGWGFQERFPTAYAVGYYLAPLRGWAGESLEHRGICLPALFMNFRGPQALYNRPGGPPHWARRVEKPSRTPGNPLAEFLRPSGAGGFRNGSPRLTPWATILRPFGAGPENPSNIEESACRRFS